MRYLSVHPSAALPVCLALWLFAMADHALAQTGGQGASGKVELIARPAKDSVLLRWAPTTSEAWTYGNRHGYMVVRYTVARDSQLIKPELRILTPAPLQPAPLAAWEKPALADKYAAVCAQAIYGSTFKVSVNAAKEIAAIYERVREQENRFSFALFSADQSFTAAQLSALAFIDRDVKRNEQYLYRVMCAVPTEVARVDTGFVFADPMAIPSLPPPMEMAGEFSDKGVVLSWNSELTKRYYTSYVVERSVDQAPFAPLSDLPYLQPETDANRNDKRTYKTDSLPDNRQEVRYRVLGRTPFGELGPPSDTVQGRGVPRLDLFPVIDSVAAILGNTGAVHWHVVQAVVPLAKVLLQRAPTDQGPFALLDSVRGKSQGTFLDRKPLPSNYYRIIAYDTAGRSVASLNYFVGLIDSIPPAIPTGLRGRVDTTGLVYLRWHPNSDADLLGYRIFRANFEKAEYIQVNRGFETDTIFADRVTLNTLHAPVFYRIAAVDKHYNESAYSQVVQLKRPDIIPPEPPVIADFRSSTTGIWLAWQPSASEDVVRYDLYRRKTGDAQFAKLAAYPAADTAHKHADTTALAGTLYEYTLVAIDSAGLESRPCKPLRAKRVDSGLRPAIQYVWAEVDRENNRVRLRWRYDQPGVQRFLVYRAMVQNGKPEPQRLLKTVTPTAREWMDANVKISNTYTYLVQAEFAGGAATPFTKTTIEF
jgi:hypothetical protein